MNRDESAEVVVQRSLPAAPETVYREWTHPEAFAAWMCPRPAKATGIELDPRVGGRLRIGIEEGATKFVVTGEYVEVDPPSRLAFTWRCSNWPDPDLNSLVIVTIEPLEGNRSLMTIRHTLLASELRLQHEAGWIAISSQLETALRERVTT